MIINLLPLGVTVAQNIHILDYIDGFYRYAAERGYRLLGADTAREQFYEGRIERLLYKHGLLQRKRNYHQPISNLPLDPAQIPTGHRAFYGGGLVSAPDVAEALLRTTARLEEGHDDSDSTTIMMREYARSLVPDEVFSSLYSNLQQDTCDPPHFSRVTPTEPDVITNDDLRIFVVAFGDAITILQDRGWRQKLALTDPGDPLRLEQAVHLALARGADDVDCFTRWAEYVLPDDVVVLHRKVDVWLCNVLQAPEPNWPARYRLGELNQLIPDINEAIAALRHAAEAAEAQLQHD